MVRQKQAAWILFIAVTAGVAMLVFHQWGLIGSLVLIALWGVFVLGVSIPKRRLQALVRKKLASMSEQERIAALDALSADERDEILDALKGQNK